MKQRKDRSVSVMKGNYWSPYIVGIFLGLAMLSSFYIMGWGLGGSRGVTCVAAYVLHAPFPQWTEKNSYFKDHIQKEKPLKNWVIWELSGMFVGGLTGAITARRFGMKLERGAKLNTTKRVVTAFIGGVLVGFAAMLAHGCSDLVALSGGATLALGSWAFIVGMFAGGYTIAYFLKGLW